MGKNTNVVVEKKVIKVAIGIPNEGHTLPESYDNHLIMASRMGAWQENMKFTGGKYRYEIYWFTSARIFTPLARERLMAAALTNGCDFLIMFDDDMTLPLGEPGDYTKDMIPMMLEDMRKHPEIDVLGALAFMRNEPHFPVIYNTIEGFDPKLRTDYYIREYVKHYPKDTLVECDAIGFGGVCIRTEFVKNKMQDPYFMSSSATGEDIWFCYQAKKAGARIFMDTRIKLGHLKNPEIIDEEYFHKWVKENKYDLGEEVPNKYLQKTK